MPKIGALAVSMNVCSSCATRLTRAPYAMSVPGITQHARSVIADFTCDVLPDPDHAYDLAW
eukprot:2902777-Rhodomonas_salina.1